MQIETAGDLRAFLAEIMVGIRDGSIEPSQAHAISKMAAQINQSLAVEVNTALQLEKMGAGSPIAGSMPIGRVVPLAKPQEVKSIEDAPDLPTADDDGKVWCDQCDDKVLIEDAAGCKSRYCSFKKVAA